MITNDVGTARGVREEDSESRRVTEHHVDSLGSLEGGGGLLDHAEFYEGEFREYFQILHNPKLRHQLMHILLITKFRYASKPNLPHQNPMMLLPNNFFRLA